MTGVILRTPADEILEQGIELGIKQGIELGIKQGIELGMNNTMALFSFLLDAGRTEEVQKALKDRAFLKKLMADFENGDLQKKNG